MTLLQYMKKVSLRKKLTLRVAKENVEKVCSEVQRTVASVEERFNLSRGTNGPEGTVSKKIQDSLILLRKGMNRLIENISSINPSFVDLVELFRTLLTTQVENLHSFTLQARGIQCFELLPRLRNDSEKVALKNHQVGCEVFHPQQKTLMCVPYNAQYWWRFCEFM